MGNIMKITSQNERYQMSHFDRLHHTTDFYRLLTPIKPTNFTGLKNQWNKCLFNRG